MSASSPGSVMLRAATAASGGTGAPACTYCSTCAWTERISAWTSTSVDGCSVSSSIRARMNGSVFAKPCSRIRRLALDDRPHGAVLELDDLGDLGDRADRVQLARIGDVLLVRLALGHQRDAAALGDGGVEGRDALLPAHLERDDHLREDDGLAKRDERQFA